MSTTSPVPDGVFGLGTSSSGPSASGRPLAPSVFPTPPAMRPTLHGRKGLVVAGHPIAAHVASTVLELGGNAIDAGVAGGLVMNVVQADMCSFGGIAPMLVRRAGEPEVSSIAGVGTWSASASIDAFVARHGMNMAPGVSTSVVPSAVAAWISALRHGGTWGFADVATWAIELAEDGFVVDPVVAAGVRVFSTTFRQWKSTTDIFCPGGEPARVGSVLIQPKLAEVIRHVADAERRALRSGSPRTGGLDAAHRA